MLNRYSGINAWCNNNTVWAVKQSSKEVLKPKKDFLLSPALLLSLNGPNNIFF